MDPGFAFVAIYLQFYYFFLHKGLFNAIKIFMVKFLTRFVISKSYRALCERDRTVSAERESLNHQQAKQAGFFRSSPQNLTRPESNDRYIHLHVSVNNPGGNPQRG